MENDLAFFEDTLPFSLEAEQSVLGGILIDPDTISTVLEYVSNSEMFSKKQHKQLFAILISMFNESKSIDFITTLNEAINSQVFSTAIEAKEYLYHLMQLVPSVVNITDYCVIVRDKYYLRRLILASQQIITAANHTDLNARQLLDLAEQKIYEIRQGRDSTSLVPVEDVVISAYDKLQKIDLGESDEYKGLSTGYYLIDKILYGLNKSDLILVAARPGMGKTSFAINIATNVAKNYNKEVCIFSLEMSNEQLVTRIFSSEAKIESEKFKAGHLSLSEWGDMAQVADRIARMPLFLDDTGFITVPEIKAKLRRFKNLGLVVIDYLQLISSGKANENRVQEISVMTRSLKIMAKELDVPVILLSQLSRAAETRQGHKPMLSDLRDSGSIEQDADIVTFLFREGYYDSTVENINLAQCIVAKNRHGSTGEIPLMWDGRYTTFINLDKEHTPDIYDPIDDPQFKNEVASYNKKINQGAT